MSENKEVNNFTRLLVLIVVGLIVVLIISNFYFYDPKGLITNGIIILIGFLILLALAELFDHMTMGKFLSLKKNYSEKKEENSSLRGENKDLRDQLIQITTNLTQIQAQSNTTVVNHGPNESQIKEWLQSIIPGDDEEIEEKEKQEDEAVNATGTNTSTPTRRRVDWQKVEYDVITNWANEIEVQEDSIQRNAKLVSVESRFDPISSHQVLFDAVLLDRQVFVEVRPNNMHVAYMRDRIYTMLSKILYYRRSTGKENACLVLFLVDFQDGREMRRSVLSRIHEEFTPAIESGLLDIRLETIEGDEMENYYKE